MNILLEKRENILFNNNHAQEIFESILAKTQPTTRELIISKSLDGDIDFSILDEYGINNLNKIVFSTKGNITSLLNIPNYVKYLECTNQLLVSIVVPTSIEYLNLEGNYIDAIDIGKHEKLKSVNLNNNKVKELTKLPKSLEELYINNNSIKLLDLSISSSASSSSSLKVLHCKGNNMFSIKGLPPSIIDLQVEDNPLLKIEYGDSPVTSTTTQEKIDKKYSFMESLDKYFSLRSKYETDLLNKKKSILRANGIEKGKKPDKKTAMQLQQVKGKCIKCQREVGTVFSLKNETYYAVCGDSVKPCALNISIYKGSHSTINEVLDVASVAVEKSKEKIICNKYDMIFQYLEEKKSVNKFKDLYSEYTLFSANHKKYMDKYDEIYNNKHQEEMYNNQVVLVYELRHKLNNMLVQYKESKKKEVLKDLMYVYSTEFIPEMHKLTTMKYKSIEMVDGYGNMISKEMETRDYKMEEILKLKELRLQDIEELISNEPKVIKFSV
jgi:hypothetical protein